MVSRQSRRRQPSFGQALHVDVFPPEAHVSSRRYNLGNQLASLNVTKTEGELTYSAAVNSRQANHPFICSSLHAAHLTVWVTVAYRDQFQDVLLGQSMHYLCKTGDTSPSDSGVLSVHE